MSITVNTNMSSIIAQRSLYKATNKMNTALERLSTGLRINSSKDDAAGSAISTKLEYKMSSYDVAKDNAQMGQSMLDTANGTLSNINSMLQRMRDLSEQASNGTYGEDERKAMQAEINGLTEEIYRIKNTTEFNGKKILGEEEASIKRVSEAEAIAQGYTVVKTAKELYSAFHNADGTQKLNAKVMLFADIDLNELGDLDGNGSNWEAIGTENNYYTGAFDGNGFTIENLKINKPNDKFQGFFGRTSKVTIENVTLKNANIVGNQSTGILCGLISGVARNCKVTGNVQGSSCVGGLCGYNSGEIEDCIAISNVSNDRNNTGGLVGVNTKIIKNSCSNGTVDGQDGGGGLVGENQGAIENCKTTSFLKKGGCSFVRSNISTNVSYKDNEYNSNINGNIIITTIAVSDDEIKDNKNLIITLNQNQNNISVNTNLQVGIQSDDTSVISVDTGFSLGDFNVSVLSEFSARNSLDKIDAMMSKITDKLTNIGATQNRLESVMEFQEIQRNALTSANSLIKDADIAKESANYVKNQIVQNVTSTLLSTANQNPSIALQLI